jgi:hypothetical protein
MNHETKQRLLWLSPLTFDGTHAGAYVRTAEMLAADIGLIILGSKVGLECGGPLAIGTLLLMGAQFAVCQSHAIEPRTDWRKRWNIKQQNQPPPDEDHE